MKTVNHFVFWNSLLLVLLTGCGTKPKDGRAENLGRVEFRATGASEAQPFFEKGLLLLHSFEYRDAAEAFRKAIAIDSSFTMAYWGEAMTLNHALWRYQDYDQAIAILNKLGPTSQSREARAKTEIERDFIRSVNILYGKGSKVERDSSYAVFLETLYKKYPGNDEVAAFYSQALIGSVAVGRDTKVYEQAAEIAKEVLKRNPRHPGALHYLIHAYDDPDHASLAIPTADAYSIVAPAAGHALHMPTHIYLALGMWDKVISSNIASWEASKKRKKEKNLGNDALNYHGYHWLMYGYLQKNRQEEARQMIDSMKKFCTQEESENAREHMIYLKTTYLAETDDFTGGVDQIEFKSSDLNIVTRAMNDYANGVKAFHEKNQVKLEEVIQRLTGARQIDEEKSVGDGARLCGSVNSATANKLDLQQALVMELELRALLAWLKKDLRTTEKYLRLAVENESKAGYSYGPPTIVKPSFELYGEWLLEMDRPKEALVQFEESLKWAPGRLLSLNGKEQAIEMLKEQSNK